MTTSPDGTPGQETQSPAALERTQIAADAAAESASTPPAANLITQHVRANVTGNELNETKLRTEYLGPGEIDQKTLDEVVDLFRFTFNNNFPEFMVCQGCETQMPAWQVLGLPEGTQVGLDVLDKFSDFPPCPCCQQTMEFFHDPQKTDAKLRGKLSTTGHASLLKSEDDKIQGFTFGYEANLRKVFENEWKNKYTYTKNPSDQKQRDYEKFLKAVRSVADIELGAGTAETVQDDLEVFCWNCGLTNPAIRGKGALPAITQKFFASLPLDRVGNLLVIGETIRDSKPHRILHQGGFHTIEGVLGGEYVLLVSKLQRLAERFMLGADAFKAKR